MDKGCKVTCICMAAFFSLMFGYWCMANRIDDKNFMVDGISVKYVRDNGADRIYSTDRKLNPKQVIKAIRVMKRDGKAFTSFVTPPDPLQIIYAYPTQWIGYQGGPYSFRVIAGKPHKINPKTLVMDETPWQESDDSWKRE